MELSRMTLVLCYLTLPQRSNEHLFIAFLSLSQRFSDPLFMLCYATLRSIGVYQKTIPSLVVHKVNNIKRPSLFHNIVKFKLKKSMLGSIWGKMVPEFESWIPDPPLTEPCMCNANYMLPKMSVKYIYIYVLWIEWSWKHGMVEILLVFLIRPEQLAHIAFPLLGTFIGW